jgi:hypothetical protein
MSYEECLKDLVIFNLYNRSLRIHIAALKVWLEEEKLDLFCMASEEQTRAGKWEWRASHLWLRPQSVCW